MLNCLLMLINYPLHFVSPGALAKLTTSLSLCLEFTRRLNLWIQHARLLYFKSNKNFVKVLVVKVKCCNPRIWVRLRGSRCSVAGFLARILTAKYRKIEKKPSIQRCMEIVRTFVFLLCRSLVAQSSKIYKLIRKCLLAFFHWDGTSSNAFLFRRHIQKRQNIWNIGTGWYTFIDRMIQYFLVSLDRFILR